MANTHTTVLGSSTPPVERLRRATATLKTAEAALTVAKHNIELATAKRDSSLRQLHLLGVETESASMSTTLRKRRAELQAEVDSLGQTLDAINATLAQRMSEPTPEPHPRTRTPGRAL